MKIGRYSFLLVVALLLGYGVADAQMPTFGSAEAQLRAWLLRQQTGKQAATPEELGAILRSLEVVRLDGGDRSAAIRFGALVLDPAFQKLAGTPDFDAVRFHLAASLARQGAMGQAREILLGLLAAKPASSMRAPAWRKLSDISLDSGQLDASLGALARLGSLSEPDAISEVAYLKGKALALIGHTDAALSALKVVERNSRRFAQAVFLTGALKLESGQAEAAEDAFCRLVHQPGDGRFTFYFNEKTDSVLQQTWLALARMRHDAGEFDRALETYAHVPENGSAGRRALYESSWSLFRMGRMREVRLRLRRLLNGSLLPAESPSARLLLAYASLGDCMFDESRSLLDKLDNDLVGVSETVDDFLGAGLSEPWPLPAKARHWMSPRASQRRLQALADKIHDALVRSRLAQGALANLVQSELEAPVQLPGQVKAAALIRDLATARSLQQRIANLRAQIGSAKGEQNKRQQLIELSRQVDEAAHRARQALNKLRGLQVASLPTGFVRGSKLPAAYLQAEMAALVQLGGDLQKQLRRVQSLGKDDIRHRSYELSTKVKGWTRQAALGRIDAILGEKQALELEVQNLALGRYPLSLLRELIEAGQLDADLEYWPYDGEEWPDEFE